MKISRNRDTQIQTEDTGFLSASCFIGGLGTGDNGDAKFELKVENSGQVEGGVIKMCGPIERVEFKKFLEQILIEMDLIEVKDTAPF